ncbi:adenine-specific DNA-methyltransferase [Oceanisphaera litoralis]|uniref:site-specific DNA-methyltransferase n=1 Tax=Oceanisphaera litoralis TaxID=225144 RepID=UPI00195B69ED|nr:DNA methyltransferase [Oceanisphaera litoralis]MBM7456425.1 adenine-specific DNA-methyltransferase [Oceanisphaera litoralis]
MRYTLTVHNKWGMTLSTLSNLLRQLKNKDAQLAADLEREIKALSNRRSFGLNFERHAPEAVELPGRKIRRGDKVRILSERNETKRNETKRNETKSACSKLWHVASITREKNGHVAELIYRPAPDADPERIVYPCDDLVVVAEFRTPIYPGLISTGSVERGGDKPFHSVINAENYHALQALLYTHEGKIDAIYIDPPYNTGAKDWKYNNDYVDTEDAYRHSKWLAMMERRLKLAKRLLNPDNSVLIVTIDEKEYLRLGLLLEQVFPGARIQMISNVINPMGSGSSSDFSRVEEYIYFVFIGSTQVPKSTDNMLSASTSKVGDEVRWTPLNRDGSHWSRQDRPNSFFPIYIDKKSLKIMGFGQAPGRDEKRTNPINAPKNSFIAWPMKGTQEACWQISGERMLELQYEGFLFVSRLDPSRETAIVRYLTSGLIQKVHNGELAVAGKRNDGSNIVRYARDNSVRPRTVWNKASHSARDHGSVLLGRILSNRKFPFPKSLYAVEDALRFFVADKPDATILDFFSGSGTTCHAVMRLNKQDGGRRQCISVTNNEVSADEQKTLRKRGLRQGDEEWERLGICEYITKPRIKAAITGLTPEGEPIKGDYKFTDEFPMSDGFEENAEFFKLSYEAPLSVAHNRAFPAIAPLLWLKAGAQGKRIDQVTEGFAIAETYGVLFDLDYSEAFLSALADTEQHKSVRMVFIVTDDDRGFASLCRDLPERVDAIRLYSSYLTNFTINTGRD